MADNKFMNRAGLITEGVGLKDVLMLAADTPDCVVFTVDTNVAIEHVKALATNVLDSTERYIRVSKVESRDLCPVVTVVHYGCSNNNVTRHVMPDAFTKAVITCVEDDFGISTCRSMQTK